MIGPMPKTRPAERGAGMFLEKLIIGRFAFEPQENGNLSLVYNG